MSFVMQYAFVAPNLIFKTLRISKINDFSCLLSHLQAERIHCKPKGNDDVNSICASFRRGWNWEIITMKFNNIELNDVIVEKVLLELKEPSDARNALGFFHWATKKKNFEHGVRAYCIAIHILVRARLLIDARALIESFLKKHSVNSSRRLVVESLLDSCKVSASDPFVFNLLVQSYAKLRMFEIALDVCSYIEEHGFSISLVSFNTLIYVVQKSDRYDMVWDIYEHMIQKRVYPNEATIRTMISTLCKGGQLRGIVDILDTIQGRRCSPYIIVNTGLILRILDRGRIEEGMAFLKRMLQMKMIADTIAFSLIIYAKVKLQKLDSALEVRKEMLNRGFQANSFVYTSLIGAYCEEGRIEEANVLMQEMIDMGLKPYRETYNHLIVGCAETGRLEECLSYYQKMIETGILPRCSTFNEMIKRLCESGDVELANSMLTILLDKGFVPNDLTYSYLMEGYTRKDDIQQVLKLYHEMEFKCLSPGLSVFTSLIGCLCRLGKLVEARKYLNVMTQRSLTPNQCIFEMLVASHFKKGDRERALQFQNEMICCGPEASAVA